MRDGKSTYQQYEIDFIATNGLNKYYIQSAYSLPTEEKREQELASLKKIDDSFRKIIIVGDDIATYMDANGYVFMGLFQFLKNEDVMEWKININTYILEQLPVEYKELTKEVDEKNQTTLLLRHLTTLYGEKS